MNEVKASVCFRRWQLRTIVCAMIGYAASDGYGEGGR